MWKNSILHIRSRAPLRIGLGGGGSDIEAYSSLYDGAVLNATISLFAYATLCPRNDSKVTITSIDKDKHQVFEAGEPSEREDELKLLWGVWDEISKENGKVKGFDLETYVDAPSGSGLGSSSTLVVAILGAFCEWLNLAYGEYDIAKIAHKIERVNLQLDGGKQDQYASTFGGFNFIEFLRNDSVIVNPLRIRSDYIDELQLNLILCYMGKSRESAKVIRDQVSNLGIVNSPSVEAMHQLKEQAFLMKKALLKGELNDIGEILHYGWQEKKKTSESITNEYIDEIYEEALKMGATGGKISGAGGGGFMMFYCPANTRYKVINRLHTMGCEFRRYQFEKNGLKTWRLNR